MLVSLMKQGYNEEANCLMVRHWCWEHQEHSTWFINVLGDAFNKADRGQHESVVTVLLSILQLDDSLKVWRVGKLLGDQQNILSLLRDRKQYHSEMVVVQL